MLSEEEKKAIDRLNEILKEWQEIVNIEDKTEREIEMSLYMEDMPFKETKIVLNLINKLQKENEEKDKQIDLMSEFISNHHCFELMVYSLDGECKHEYECKECIKQYFEKLAKEKGNQINK